MGDYLLKHLMRIYGILFLLFGLLILAMPNLVMDILNLPHTEGYFWSINIFAYLVLMAVLSFYGSNNPDLIKFIIFAKFFSALIFLIFGLALFNTGLLISGLVDTSLGFGILIGKKL